MFMQVINFIMDAGSSVFMPVIIFALGLVFGLKPSKSFGAGITVGIGFIGINLVIELLANNLMVVIDQLVELYHFKLTAIDVADCRKHRLVRQSCCTGYSGRCICNEYHTCRHWLYQNSGHRYLELLAVRIRRRGSRGRNRQRNHRSCSGSSYFCACADTCRLYSALY